MRHPTSPRFLTFVLAADAASAAACGLVQLAAPEPLSAWFGLPATLLTATGWVLLAVAVFAALTARSPSRAGVLALAAGNAAWVAGCVELLVTGVAGSALGMAWIAVQAVAVGVLAELEWLALRRAPAAARA